MSNSMDRLVKEVRGETENFVEEAVDYSCVEMMRKTEPFGASNKVMARFEESIEDQIKWVVVGVSPGFERFLESKHGLGVRNAVEQTVSWNAKDGTLKELKIAKLALDASQDDIQDWHNRFRDRRGRVPYRTPRTIMMVPKASFELYARRKKALAGTAKAGWVGAFKQINFHTPKWIARNGLRAKVKRVSGGSGNEFFERAHNKVSYVSELVGRSGFSRSLKGAMGTNAPKWSKKVKQKMDELAKRFSESK